MCSALWLGRLEAAEKEREKRVELDVAALVVHSCLLRQISLGSHLVVLLLGACVGGVCGGVAVACLVFPPEWTDGRAALELGLGYTCTVPAQRLVRCFWM